MAGKWYNVSIMGKEINWASVAASAVLFVGLEIWRRKYIEKTIKKQVEADVEIAVGKIPPRTDDRTILEQIIDRI